MLPTKFPGLLLVAACLLMAGCATAPNGSRTRVVDLPFAAAQSDLAFTMTGAARPSQSCTENAGCPSEQERAAAGRFSRQVQRLAAMLDNGAQVLYPDLAQRVPGLTGRRFEVYVVEGKVPGSASSANGRVTLNAALGAGQPDDGWVAFVIAREMGHVIARHPEENSAAGFVSSLILNLIIPGGGLLKSLVSAGGSGIAATSKKDVQAVEADAIAYRLLKASGFPLRKVSRSLLGAPVVLDDGGWSKRFRKSSDNLVAEVRSTEFSVVSAKQRKPDGIPKQPVLD